MTLRGFFDGSFDRLSLQKLAYFLQVVGIEFKLTFARNDHGQYSETLKKAYVAFEDLGMISRFTTGDRQAHVTPSGCAVVDEYLVPRRGFELELHSVPIYYLIIQLQ